MATRQATAPVPDTAETPARKADAPQQRTAAAVADAAPDTPDAEIVSAKRRMPDNLRRYLIRMQGGKFYLPAAYRIVWFRDECPDWGVETMLLEGGQQAGFATVQAKIYDSSGKVIASGMKTETQKDFPAGWVEKAETGSIGRALAVAGFGTQFAAELDEAPRPGEMRVVDSPQPVGRSAYAPPARQAPHVMEGQSRTVRLASDDGESAANGSGVLPAGSVWEGPGQCPRCHAPEGKRHLRPCVA